MSVQSKAVAIAAALAGVGETSLSSIIKAVAELLEDREARDVEVLLQTLRLNRVGHVDEDGVRAEVVDAMRAKFGGLITAHVDRIIKARGMTWLRAHLESVG